MSTLGYSFLKCRNILKALHLIGNTEFRSARQNFKTSVLPRNFLVHSNVLETFPEDDQNRRRDEIKHDRPETSQNNKIKALDQTLMNLFEKLKQNQKSTDCEKNKVPKMKSTPKFTWVESQKLKPNIARNLALFGKPFNMKVPTQPPKLPVIQLWNPLSSKTGSLWKPMSGGNWIE